MYAFSRCFLSKATYSTSRLYIFLFVSMCELKPQPFALLMQCSTTEPQEHNKKVFFAQNVLKLLSLFKSRGSVIYLDILHVQLFIQQHILGAMTYF